MAWFAHVVRGGADHFAVVLSSYFLALPMRPGRLVIEDLESVHAYVAFAGFWVTGYYAR